METQASINLSYLAALCDGDNEFMNTIIASFINEMPEILSLIQQKMREGNWKAVGELAHKMKPSIQFVGMDVTLEKVRNTECHCRSTNVCSDQVSLLVNDITQETETAIIALQEILNE